MARRDLSFDAPWCSVSDLAEYAYCPRAHWYRHHPDRAGVEPQSVRSQAQGVRFHERELGQVEADERHARLWLALLGVGVLLVVGTLYLAGWL